jgi:hypothetical protein
MPQDCPRCGLISPAEAQRCDCGYDFDLRRVAGSYLTNKDLVQKARAAEAEEEGMRVWDIVSRLFRLFGR